MPFLVPGISRTATAQTTLGGSGANQHRIIFRARGVIDLKNVVGGTLLQRHLVLGGTAAADNNTLVTLAISNPAATYILNRSDPAVPLDYNSALDYAFDAIVQGNATLTLTIDNIDSLQYKGDAAGNLITKAPVGAYDGIWFQLDAGPLTTYNVVKGGGVRGWLWSAFAENVYGIKADK